MRIHNTPVHSLAMITGISGSLAFLISIMYVWVRANVLGYTYFTAGEPNAIIKYTEWIIALISVYVLFRLLIAEIRKAEGG